MPSRIRALHQRLQALTRTAGAEWQSQTSRVNANGEEESWLLHIRDVIMVGLTYKGGKWVVSSGTLPWFPNTTLKAQKLVEAKPAAIRVVQAFLRKNVTELDPFSK